MADAPKESKTEIIKRESRHLRGRLAEELQEPSTHFSEESAQLLKFHGSYQQDDRDVRHARRAAKEEVAYQFMVRVAIPGGVLSAEQYLVLDDLADRYGNGTLRVTTRQGMQFHGVLKRDLKAHIAAINHALMSTLAACGDVERNVMACPAPLADEAHATVRRLAKEIAKALRPGSGAYHEIWLDGEKHLSTESEEPFYGDTYLPRKFKTGVTHALDNSIDVYSYDCGLIAFLEGSKVVGYNVLAGGGMGLTHNKADTFAALAQPVGFVGPAHAIEAVKTVAAIFRDTGNRADRRHARLKYVLAERGLAWFQEEFRRRANFPVELFRPLPRPQYRDYLGAHPQGDGRQFYGVYIENGRIGDRNGEHLRTALREIVTTWRPGVVLTPNQNLLLTDLALEAVPQIESALHAHGAPLPSTLSAARRYALACVALPTCGLAMAEAERLMPSVVERFEKELENLGLRDVPLTLRMTGCPNGCARPYTADIAFVGRAPDVYNIHVGGGLGGDRIADLYAANVRTEDLVSTLRPLLAAYAAGRQNGESLGDFYQRHLPPREARITVTGKETPTRDLVQLELKV